MLRLRGMAQSGENVAVTGVESINAITLRTSVMAASVRFYEALGFRLTYGGDDAPFSTLRSEECFVNLIAVASAAEAETGWGRAIFHVSDVDALYQQALDAGLTPQAVPRDAPWGERMFPITDPAGHDLSFAKRIRSYEVDHPDL